MAALVLSDMSRRIVDQFPVSDFDNISENILKDMMWLFV